MHFAIGILVSIYVLQIFRQMLDSLFFQTKIRFWAWLQFLQVIFSLFFFGYTYLHVIVSLQCRWQMDDISIPFSTIYTYRQLNLRLSTSKSQVSPMPVHSQIFPCNRWNKKKSTNIFYSDFPRCQLEGSYLNFSREIDIFKNSIQAQNLRTTNCSEP